MSASRGRASNILQTGQLLVIVLALHSVESIPTTTLPLPAAQRPYKRIQYVGFPVQTGYNGYLGPNMLFYGENNGVGSYVGLEDIEQDIDARIDIMARALHAAQRNATLDTRNDTLKIFLAPEFFFRGPKGAYHASAPPLMKIGAKLAKLVEDTRFSDWVFVFGSIIGFNENKNLTDPSVMRAANGSNGSAVQLLDTYNFAIIQQGGPDGERHTHFKRFISHIDFLSVAINEAGSVVYPNMNLNSPDFNTTLHPKGIIPKTVQDVEMLYPLMSKEHLEVFEQNLGSTVNGGFYLAGVRFCLDVCLDHARGVCAQALDKEKQHGGPGRVQVQLVVSAGMSIEPLNTRVPAGGSVLLCDGLGSGAQQLVTMISDEPANHLHTVSRSEAAALSASELDSGEHWAVDADYQGKLEGQPVAVFPEGDEWKEIVGKVFSAQKYKLRLELDKYPIIEAALNYALQTVPQDYIFMPVELAEL